MSILNILAVDVTSFMLIDNPKVWLQTHGLNILFIISGSWFIGKIVTTVVHGVLVSSMKDHTFRSDNDRKKRADTLNGLISATVRLITLLVAIAMIIDEIGINTAPFLASAGVVGVALGIGAQSFIKDFVSGVFIISENQYRVGDVVDLSVGGQPVSGTVESITIRTTILRDIAGTRHHIPNGSVVVASNKTFGFSKLNEILVVSQDTDLDKLKKIIDAIGVSMTNDKHVGILIKEPLNLAQIGGYNGVGITVFVRGSTTAGGQWKVKSAFYSRLQTELKKAKIKLPVTPLPVPDKVK